MRLLHFYVELNGHPKKRMLNLFFVNVYATSAVSSSGSIRFRIFSFFSFLLVILFIKVY